MSKLWQKWNGHLFIGLLVFGFVFLLSGCGTEDKPDYAAMNGQEAVIDYENVSVLRLMTEQSFAMMTEQYIVATAMTAKAARFDTDKLPPEAFFVEVKRVQDAWDSFEQLKKRTLILADALAKVEKKAAEKKVAINLIPMSRVYAADDVKWRQMVNKSYEDFSSGQEIAGMTARIGSPDVEEKSKGYYGMYSQKEWQNMTEEQKKAANQSMAQEVENTKTGLKVAAVGTGILMIPTGIGVGLYGVGTALSTGTALGVAQAGVGFVATMAGGLSTAMSVGADASGTEFQGVGKAIKNNVDFIAVVSSGANMVMGVAQSGVNVAQNLSNTGKTVSMKEFAKMTAKDFMANQSLTERVLMVNDAKSAAELAAALKEQGMDYFVGTTPEGKPCITMKKKVEEQPEPVNIDELSDEQLMAEITERRAKIDNMRKQTADLRDTNKDWIFQNACGMSGDEFDKRRWALNDLMYEAVDKDEWNEYFRLSKIRDSLTGPYEAYIKSDEYKQELERRKQAYADKGKELSQLADELAEMEEEKKLRDQMKQSMQEIAEREKNKDISGKVSGKVSDDAPYAVNKIMGVKGTTTRDEPQSFTIKVGDQVITETDTTRYVDNWLVVPSGESFALQHDSEVFSVKNPSVGKKGQAIYTVKSYDTGTGNGTAVSPKGKTVTFSIAGELGSMTITVVE